MTSQRTKSKGLSPSEKPNVLAATKKVAVTEESARAEKEKVWEDVFDDNARSSGSAQDENMCRPCGEDVTVGAVEEAPVKIARDPGDPTEEEFEKHWVTHLPFT